MSKSIEAEYDASSKTLHLAEALEGVRDHAKVRVDIVPSADSDPDRPWTAVRGTLSEEAADELSRLVNEMFPPWND